MKKNVKDRKWFKLDNAAKLYPSIVSTRVSTVFRLSAILYENVDAVVLQEALNNILPLFKHFNVRLRRGLFWYYFEEASFTPIVQEESYYPCMFLDFKERKTQPFRVIYYKNRISIEISHSVTDGSGAIVFLKAILASYCKLKGLTDKCIKELLDIDFTSGEVYEDAFHKYYNSKIPEPPKLNKAFHLSFPLNKKGEYYIITGIIPTDKFYSLAKSYNTTVTKFVLAVYFESILEYINLEKIKKIKRARPVTINVPVNLRNLFPSNTLRNFFVSLTPSIDPRLGQYSFEEIITYIDHYFGLRLNKKYINQYISRNVKNEISWKIKLIPLPIKNLGMPWVYSHYGEINFTSGISNLGKVILPEPLAAHVDRIDIYPPPSEGNLIKMGMLSYNNKTCISFGSLTTNRSIERNFFTKLRKMGLPIKIETNT